MGQFWRRGLAVVGRGLGGPELSAVTIASSSVANTSSRSATARGFDASSAKASLSEPWQMCTAGNIFETVLNSLSPVDRGRSSLFVYSHTVRCNHGDIAVTYGLRAVQVNSTHRAKKYS